MSASTALLTFSLGPVHTFIGQARRIADLWAGSTLLSHLIGRAIDVVLGDGGCAMVLPAIDAVIAPRGVPNRFVCRVPRDRAEALAGQMRQAVEAEWDRLVGKTIELLDRVGVAPVPAIWRPEPGGLRRQTDGLFEIAWSWVPEENGYAHASDQGARQFAASRTFRPAVQISELGEKCAICGERTALPNGERHDVRKTWDDAEKRAAREGLASFVRADQTRLCLVCSTKRLFPKVADIDAGAATRQARFEAFSAFQPSQESPYFAVVSMDGDHMGTILGWGPEKVPGGDVEIFHRRVSAALSGFAGSLYVQDSAALNLGNLGVSGLLGTPQLIYAGGEDVLFVCDPRDALGVAQAVRKAYRDLFAPLEQPGGKEFTISAAILFAHTKHPAGMLFRDADDLLARKAKRELGRDAVAIRLAKRGGVPVEVGFKWDEAVDGDTWIDRLNRITGDVYVGMIAARKTIDLVAEETVLTKAFTNVLQWESWLTDRLSRGEVSGEEATQLGRLMAPFFTDGKTEALRIARFLGREVYR